MPKWPATNDSLNILIIDDDRGDRMMCQEALKSAWGDKMRFMEADSGESGLEAIEKHAVHCVLLDHSLPGIDGMEVLRRIRIKHPYLAVVMIDGKGDDAIAVQAMMEGAQDYIPKVNITAGSIRRISGNAMEKATLQREVAQQREELENFARLLVHDLKAPTRSIQGFAGIMERDIHDGKLEKIARNCRYVIEAAQRMDVLIDTLRQYTEVDERVVFEPVEMRQVMKDTLSNLQQLIRERGARVTYDELPVVTGNASQLAQLLQNLISNGIKYCTAEVPSTHVAASPQKGNTWSVSVKDNGIGIDHEYLQQVFKPFRRLHGADQYAGTGLGLATCKKIIERHGGSIWCESEEGQGTTFFFTLQGIDNHV